MLHGVEVGRQAIRSYEATAGGEAVDALVDLARPLQGARVLHVNATPYGGGVAEILRSEVPLLRDLGLLADWRIITGDDEFFAVTKAVHNGLQGAARTLTDAERDVYLDQSRRNAALLEEEYDLVVVHDPQPLPIPAMHGRGGLGGCGAVTSTPPSRTRTSGRSFAPSFLSTTRRCSPSAASRLAIRGPSGVGMLVGSLARA